MKQSKNELNETATVNVRHRFQRKRTSITFIKPSMAKQSMRDECDINLIVDRYRKSGAVSHLARGVPQFSDVSQVGDYRTAIENARAAEEFFSKLPAKLRAAFSNDVAEYLEALQDPGAADRLEKLADEFYPSRRARETRKASEAAAAAVSEAPPEAEGLA